MVIITFKKRKLAGWVRGVWLPVIKEDVCHVYYLRSTSPRNELGYEDSRLRIFWRNCSLGKISGGERGWPWQTGRTENRKTPSQGATWVQVPASAQPRGEPWSVSYASGCPSSRQRAQLSHWEPASLWPSAPPATLPTRRVLNSQAFLAPSFSWESQGYWPLETNIEAKGRASRNGKGILRGSDRAWQCSPQPVDGQEIDISEMSPTCQG